MKVDGGAELVLRALRTAPSRLSVEQIADETGLTNDSVELHLVSLRTAGLARVWTRNHKRGSPTRSPLVLWRAAAPDPM